MMKARMLVTSGGERNRHLDALARYLGDGDRLVVAVDTYRENDAELHVPLDPGAELVAVEPPVVLGDGSTEIVSYVVCRQTTRFRRVRVQVDGTMDADDVDVETARSFGAGGSNLAAA